MEIKNKTKKLPKILIFVGMAGSGKTIVVNYFKEKGWQTIHFGEITINELNKKGLPINEENEKAIREEIRKKIGMDAYAKLSFPLIKEKVSKGPTIIDGLYSWAEYRYLEEKFKGQMVIINIFTSRHLRYKRLTQRKYRPLSTMEAKLRDFAEIENLEKGGPIAIADYSILNNSNKNNLYEAVDNLLIKIYHSNS